MPKSSPGSAYYWSFDGLVRTKNIPGEFVGNGEGAAWRNAEIYRSDATYTLHGDNLWEQSPATVNEVSVESYFAGKTYYRLINNEWVWQSTIGTSRARGQFSGHPFRFKRTDHVFFDYYGYSDIVRYNIFSGKVTEAVMAIFPIPEPSTMFLFGTGIASLAAVRRRRK